MRCGDKIEERAEQQNIRLCRKNPDGTEDCAGDEKAGMVIRENSACLNKESSYFPSYK